MKINAGQAPSTLIPEYIGSDFDKVIEVADNIEYIKHVAGMSGLGANVHIGATPPTKPKAGSEWYCTTDGRTYVWYADADSSQWVESSPQSPIEIDPATADNIFTLWKRSASEAGLNLVAGSFEEGGVLTSSTDVLWHKGLNSIYSWSGAFPKTVAPGTDPTTAGSGYTPRTDVVLRGELLDGALHMRDGLFALRDIVSVKDFGAVGDFNPADQSGTDDTAAFLAALASGIKVIKIPKGNYKITSTFVLDRCVSWLGDTSYTSRIYFFDCDGFIYNLETSAKADPNDQVIFRDISLCTTSRGYTGISVSRFAATNKPRVVLLEDVALIGADVYWDTPNNQWPGQPMGYRLEWGCGFKGDQVDSCTLNGVYIRGCSQNHETEFPGASIGVDISNSTFVNIFGGCNINFTKIGIRITGQSEGIKVYGNDIGACETGYMLDAPNGGSSHHTVINNHFNPTKCAISINLGGHSIIADNFILKRIPTALESVGGHPFTYINMVGNDSIVRDNLLQSNPANIDYVGLGDTGILISGNNNLCSGNYGYNVGTMHRVVSGQYNTIFSGKEHATGTSTAKYLVDTAASTMCGNYYSTEDGGANLLQFPMNVSFGDPIKSGVNFIHHVRTGGLGALYDSRWEYSGGTASNAQGTCRFTGKTLLSTAQENIITNVLKPAATNTVSLGVSGLVWSGGFTQTAFTVTSDERVKSQPLAITDAMLDAAAEVDWVQYQYLDRVEAKGPDGARWHFGAVAQRYVEAFARHGLDAHDYGFLCYDEWEASPAEFSVIPAILDKAGNVLEPEQTVVIQEAREAGSLYGIRYEEALALEAALQRRNYQRLLDRVEALEAK